MANRCTSSACVTLDSKLCAQANAQRNLRHGALQPRVEYTCSLALELLAMLSLTLQLRMDCPPMLSNVLVFPSNRYPTLGAHIACVPCCINISSEKIQQKSVGRPLVWCSWCTIHACGHTCTHLQEHETKSGHIHGLFVSAYKDVRAHHVRTEAA